MADFKFLELNELPKNSFRFPTTGNREILGKRQKVGVFEQYAFYLPISGEGVNHSHRILQVLWDRERYALPMVRTQVLYPSGAVKPAKKVNVTSTSPIVMSLIEAYDNWLSAQHSGKTVSAQKEKEAVIS